GVVVSGTVTDVGGGPIPDARITAGKDGMPDLSGRAELVTTTNAEGKYEITLPSGSFDLAATHDDYTSMHRNIEVESSPLTVDFSLVPGAVVRGQVVARDSGKGVPGALVRAEGGRGGRGDDGTAIADENGNFTLRSLGSGVMEIHAMGRGYATTDPTSVAVGIGEQVEGVRVLVDRAYSISGKVVRKGKPDEGVPGITLGAFSIAAKSFGLALEPSAKDGSFEIVGVKPASYMLFAVGEGSVPDIGKNVEVVDKDVEDVIVELATGVTISGRVEPALAATDMSLAPAGEIGIANMFEAAKALLVRGATDASGTFTLHNVPAGSFELKGMAPDGHAGQLAITVAETDQSGLVVKLDARASVSGRVVDTTGAAVGGTRVTARRLDDDDRKVSFSIGERRGGGALTSPDGTFKLVGLEAGKYMVRALEDRDDFMGMLDKKPAGKSSVELQLVAGVEKPNVVLTIEARDGVIRGTVMGTDKKPAADAWVTAHLVQEMPDKVPDFAKRRLGRASPPVLTNDSGQFTISKLKKGTYDLVVDGPKGGSRAEKKGVKTGENVTIVLEALGTLSGKVTLGGEPVTSFDIECDAEHDVERHVDAKDGAYTLERLAPGPYDCSVSANAGTGTGKIDVPAGPATLDFQLTRYATVTGVVVDVLTKKPLAGLNVVAGGDMFNNKSVADMFGGRSPKTDANGRFLAERVAVGKGKVTVMPKSGFQPLGQRDYTAAEGQRVDVGTIEVVPPRDGDAGTFGLSTNIDGDKLMVSSVKDGGPAATAGIQVGDRIMSIMGRDVAALTPVIAQTLLASGTPPVGMTISVALDRGGSPVTATMTSVKW
ncbi:MAG: PDZ domain-containing protein, partial [Kofleriaceae bacterium]|nr:PDZ domain-containing protein [Kofleriaceae bacterium]